jgi:hypothetical protein
MPGRTDLSKPGLKEVHRLIIPQAGYSNTTCAIIIEEHSLREIYRKYLFFRNYPDGIYGVEFV